jgi:DNA-binding PadR family transcriptional regulator
MKGKLLLKHRKRHSRFWKRWGEAKHSFEDNEPIGFGPRQAWMNHFETFLGVKPEKHWLFSGRRFKPWFSGRMGPPGLFNPFVAEVLSRGGGLLSLYVLHLLSEKPRYGNDIMKEIKERTQRRWGSNPGAIYPLLTELEESELIDGTWEDPEKRTRRIYSLTATGQKELERLKDVMRPKLEEAINVLRHLSNDLDVGEEE